MRLFVFSVLLLAINSLACTPIMIFPRFPNNPNCYAKIVTIESSDSVLIENRVLCTDSVVSINSTSQRPAGRIILDTMETRSVYYRAHAEAKIQAMMQIGSLWLVRQADSVFRPNARIWPPDSIDLLLPPSNNDQYLSFVDSVMFPEYMRTVDPSTEFKSSPGLALDGVSYPYLDFYGKFDWTRFRSSNSFDSVARIMVRHSPYQDLQSNWKMGMTSGIALDRVGNPDLIKQPSIFVKNRILILPFDGSGGLGDCFWGTSHEQGDSILAWVTLSDSSTYDSTLIYLTHAMNKGHWDSDIEGVGNRFFEIENGHILAGQFKIPLNYLDTLLTLELIADKPMQRKQFILPQLPNFVGTPLPIVPKSAQTKGTQKSTCFDLLGRVGK